jgi:rod shape-determining protein MreD
MFNTHHWLVVVTTLLVALMLTLLPMPGWTVWLRPAWTLLVLIYWGMEAPDLVNVGTAWLVGIILDVLNGTLLGEHALALTFVIYIVVHMHSRLRMFPLLQQSIMVFLLVLIYQFILYCVQGFINETPHGLLFWSSSLTSMLLWPWVYSIMQDCRRRFKVA